MPSPKIGLMPALLLVESESLMRGIVASAARQLQLARVQEATSVRSAERLLESHDFDLLLIALDDEGLSLQLIADLRRARYISGRDIPVAVMTDACDRDLIGSLKSLQVRKVVIKPFKARTLLDAIADLCRPLPDDA